MATRQLFYIFVAFVGMLVLSMIAQTISELKACVTIECCCMAAIDREHGDCAPGNTPQTCPPHAACCDIDPTGSHQAPQAAAAVQTQPRASGIALQTSPASVSLKTVESGFDTCRCMPPVGGNIPVYLRTLTLLC